MTALLWLTLIGTSAISVHAQTRATVQEGRWAGCAQAWGDGVPAPASGSVIIQHRTVLAGDQLSDWDCNTDTPDNVAFPDGIRLEALNIKAGAILHGDTFRAPLTIKGNSVWEAEARITGIQDFSHFGNLQIAGKFTLETDMVNHNVIDISGDVSSGASTGAGPSKPILTNLSADSQVSESYARINFVNDADMIGPGAGTIVNNGVIQKLGGEQDSVVSWRLKNSYNPASTRNRAGELGATKGTLVFATGGDLEGASFVVAPEATVELRGGTNFYLGQTTEGDAPFSYVGSGGGRVIISGAIQGHQQGFQNGVREAAAEPTAVLDFPERMLFFLGATQDMGPIENKGFLQIDGPAATSLNGFRNAGTIIVESGASFRPAGTGSFLNLSTGVIEIAKGGRIVPVGGSNYLRNEGEIRAEGTGHPVAFHGIENTGLLHLRDGSFEIDWSPSLAENRSVLSGGRWIIEDSRLLFGSNISRITENNAEVSLVGRATHFENLDWLATNTGTLALLQGQKFQPVQSDFTNVGTLEIGIDSSFHAGISTPKKVTAGGDLKITFGDEISPGAWRIVNASEIEGTFATTEFANVPGGMTATVRYLPQSIEVILDGGTRAVPEGLLAFWDFEDNTSPLGAHSCVGDQVARIDRAFYTREGRNGSGIAIDSTTRSLQVGDASFADSAASQDQLTISFWHKAPADSVGITINLESSAAPAPNNRGAFAFIPTNSTFPVWDTMGQFLSADIGTDWKDNEWHHWAFVKNGGSKSVYLDGERVLHQESGAAPLAGPFTGLRIGYIAVTGSSAATLDDLALFSTALTQEAIMQLASGATDPIRTIGLTVPPKLKTVHQVGYNAVTKTMTFGWDAEVGASYEIEISNDLFIWESLQTVVAESELVTALLEAQSRRAYFRVKKR